MEDRIGDRIAVERKLRGLTQHQLADRAHVSLSLLRKVEQGSRPASPAVVSSVARALGLELARLTGQPYYSGNRRRDALHDLIPPLRRELGMYGLPPEEDAPPRTLADLEVRVSEASDLVQSVAYMCLGQVLPGLLADLRAAVASTTGETRTRVLVLLRETYDNAKRLAYDLGYADLGALAVSLEERAAEESGDPLEVALSRAVRAWTLTGSGAFTSAYRLLVDTADGLEPVTADGMPQAFSVWGFLHLQAALSAARSGDAPRTWDHYAAAQHASARLDGDRDDFRLSFGPTNTAVWGVGLAVELQDGPAAVARAGAVVIPQSLPKARAGHHYLDLARGHFYNGDPASALDSLVRALRIAPQQVRYNPMARETAMALARTERRSTESLRRVASWMGLHA
ncbi:MAG TPA: helix-turn-helix transcriptional regulator [Cryptosporangiaceae bacterium]|nr:helix-turn-helix transcriptional regulator [Cryptosporangiaceae bacterium]